MSIYSKQITLLDYADIDELLTEGTRENIRLEYKRELPGKFETLKKLSSFANTYGGYVVIGAEEDGNGNLTALPGINQQSGFNQRVTQWCYDGVYPPLQPYVSNAVSHPSKPNRFFYVIYVNQSHEAPHFLNDRKGCFIRTDEFSQRFEATLATYEEIQHLANRRERSIDLRERTIDRARARLEEHIRQNYGSRPNVRGEIDVTMWLAIAPLMPGTDPFQVPIIQRALDESRLGARDTMFPNGSPQAQLDGFFFPDPRIINFSYLEVETHGLIFYAEELGHIDPDTELEEGMGPDPEDIYLYISWVIAWVIFYMRYAKGFYSAIGYDGPLLFRLGLERIRGRQFRIAFNPSGTRFDECRPMLDDSIYLEREIDTRAIQEDLIGLISELFRAVSFSCGWSRAYTAEDDFIEASVDRALGYLKWPREILTQ